MQQESEFFDLDKADYGLVAVQAEVWEGFIFVNLDPENTTSAREYLGELGAGLEGYPFGEMTQVYKYRAEVGSNWKLFIDAFAEFYHAPVLHAKQAVADESRKLQGDGFEALAYDIDGPTAWCRHGAAWRRPRTRAWSSRSSGCCAAACSAPGTARHRHRRPAAGHQPGPPPGVGRRHVRLLPQLHAAGVGAGLVPHVPLLADVAQHAHLRGHALLRPAEDGHASACARSSQR